SSYRYIFPEDKRYCTNTPPNLDTIHNSIDNFCHLNSYSKIYKTVKIIFYDYPKIIKKSLEFKGNRYVNESKWFKRTNYQGTFPEENLNFLPDYKIEKPIQLGLDEYYIYIGKFATLNSVRYSPGIPRTWGSLSQPDYAVIYGII
ncbi:hypothetical protein SNEBB_004015, partial [Seison nebaliae]